MQTEHEVTQWLSRLGQGDEQACQVIWQQYFEKLVRYARRKMEGCRGRDADEEDIALSAMNSFCQGMRAGQFEKVDDREDLWKLLVTITARKACSRRRREMAAKRGGGMLRGESIFMRVDDMHEAKGGIDNVLGREPSPELADGLVGDCHQMLDSLEDETLREIAVLTLEGHRPREIAEKLGCVKRTVERKLERIREKWSKTVDAVDA